MVSADCELTSIFRNIGQRISQNGYVARFRDFLAQGVKAREPQARSSGASMACRSAHAATATGFATSRVRPAFRTRSLEYGPRAGGATEAGEAGAALEAIQGALTHTNKVTTLRYLRGRRTKKLSEIAEARNSKRAAENDGGTA